MHVLIAPDSFKGSASALDVASALRTGWLSVRPDDDVRALPLADGGEGTLAVVEATTPGAERQWTPVIGPAGPMTAPWLLCPDGTAVVELAEASGLPLHPALDPLGAHTLGFGQLLAAAAADPRVNSIVAAVGGSASTDGGTGALSALGARFLGAGGEKLPLGGGHLVDLDRIDTTDLVPPPAGGVQVLADVDAPLLGPHGAAAQFGPQKGATAADVGALEAGLKRLADFVGVPERPGFGAAGGTAYGLAALWDAQLAPGAATVGALAGFAEAVAAADVVITGEGRLDHQSFRGKVVGNVASTGKKAGVPVWACVGQQVGAVPSVLAGTVVLSALAASPDEAMANPQHWLERAGRELAELA